MCTQASCRVRQVFLQVQLEKLEGSCDDFAYLGTAGLSSKLEADMWLAVGGFELASNLQRGASSTNFGVNPPKDAADLRDFAGEFRGVAEACKAASSSCSGSAC